MNVVDSSGWLEYFAGAPNADFFAPAIEAPKTLIVPTVTLYEVFKHFNRFRSEQDGLQAVAIMRQGNVIALTDDLALYGAQLSLQYGIPMADSIILATASSSNATLWTQDADFKNIPGVQYRPKPKPPPAKK